MAQANTAGAGSSVSVFAQVPSPGHPSGIVVHQRSVYVSTSAGLPFAHFNNDDERVFRYTLGGKLLSSTRIDTAPGSNEGLFALAVDGKDRLYVGDVNGRILRYTPGRSGPRVWASTPEPYHSGGWYAAAWNGVAFDARGSMYVADYQARIWRIIPSGDISIWFSDARLTGSGVVIGGPYGAQIGPDGKLYFAVTDSMLPGGDRGSVIYRLPLKREPASDDLEEFHRFPAVDDVNPDAAGIAFGRSGRLYVSLASANQIAVLKPNGKEERRISSPHLYGPWGLAFLGKSLLVANSENNFVPDEHPDGWQILKVSVGERGLPPYRPRNVK